ncbi:MAG TPA: trigger factor [Candidatus Onthovivens sp.]|nr:trigger factor [Candidatus Onthovivens sp.]
MATKLENKGNSLIEITGKVTAEEFAVAKEAALKKIAQTVSIKGFRKGKAPINLVKETVSEQQIISEAINEAGQKLFRESLNEHKVQPAAQPEMDVTKFDGNEVEYVFRVIVAPSVEIGKYTGIKVENKKVSVTADEIEAAIAKLLNENSDLVLKDSEAALGDTVVFDFKGYIDGKEFEGGSADNYSLVLGSNQFVPGFEDQLVGVKSGQKIDINVTFPEQYVKEYAGKDAKFVCIVHEIKTKKINELNDEFVKSLALENVNTVEELKLNQKEQITQTKENEKLSNQLNELIGKIVEGSKFEINEKIIEAEIARNVETMMEQIKQNGITFEQYKEITGLTDEKIHDEVAVNVQNQIKQALVLSKITELEKLYVTKEELEEYYANVAKQYSMETEKVKEIFAKNEGQIIQNITNGKIQTFLVEKNINVKKEKTTN